MCPGLSLGLCHHLCSIIVVHALLGKGSWLRAEGLHSKGGQEGEVRDSSSWPDLGDRCRGCPEPLGELLVSPNLSCMPMACSLFIGEIPKL